MPTFYGFPAPTQSTGTPPTDSAIFPAVGGNNRKTNKSLAPEVGQQRYSGMVENVMDDGVAARCAMREANMIVGQRWSRATLQTKPKIRRPWT